ncbi:MAG: hypothetical protein P8175_16795 [Deltaproteobacteria bacterium]|jgi:membrane protein implicated in regulation of membrane protease activity
MTGSESLPLKNATLWFLLFCCGLTAGYLVFVGLVSIWVGVHQVRQNGFWLPIAAGALVVFAASWLFHRLARFLYSQIRQTDRLQL